MGKNEWIGRMRNKGDMMLPSQKWVNEHYLTHVLCRNWRPCCVGGTWKDLDHRTAVEEDRRIREFTFDSCFPRDEKGANITVLVERERVTGITMASVVPLKGTSGQLVALKMCGGNRDPLKDQPGAYDCATHGGRGYDERSSHHSVGEVTSRQQ